MNEQQMAEYEMWDVQQRQRDRQWRAEHPWQFRAALLFVTACWLFTVIAVIRAATLLWKVLG